MKAREQRYIKTQARDRVIRRLFKKKRFKLGVEYRLHYLIYGPHFAVNNSWKRPHAAPTFRVYSGSQSKRTWLRYKNKKKPYRHKRK